MNVSSRAGDFAAVPGLDRGLALGDLDNDGATDLVTNSLDNRLINVPFVAAGPGTEGLVLQSLASFPRALSLVRAGEHVAGQRLRLDLRSEPA